VNTAPSLNARGAVGGAGMLDVLGDVANDEGDDCKDDKRARGPFGGALPVIATFSADGDGGQAQLFLLCNCGV